MHHTTSWKEVLFSSGTDGSAQDLGVYCILQQSRTLNSTLNWFFLIEMFDVSTEAKFGL